MIRLFIALLMLVGGSSPCWADDLTDAITSVDPRSRLQTGTGVVLHKLLGPEEKEEEPAAAGEELESATTLPSYGLTAKDLHDPMGTLEKENDLLSSDSDAPEEDSAVGGFANEEAGVHYQDTSSSYLSP